MPEAGYLPIPQKLARAGVKDMVRISDARMSGTAFGSIVLHVTPDAASGGPLAKVSNGDHIRLSVEDRRIDLLVAPEELARRPATPPPVPERGYARLYRQRNSAGRPRLRFRLPAQASARPIASAWLLSNRSDSRRPSAPRSMLDVGVPRGHQSREGRGAPDPSQGRSR